MQPDKTKITIGNNKALVIDMLMDLVLQPRLQALKWAQVTKQTPNMKIGYPGQHLVSLVTGMEGTRTGARGHDLIDGAEVKSCSRVDQVDKCKVKTCQSKVMRYEMRCPKCNTDKIKRNDDSKWLFTIRSPDDLQTLLSVPRVILAIADYPNFEMKDFDTLNFRVFEIWPQNLRHKAFRELMQNYYLKIYRGQKNIDIEKTPAPKNFWPYSYQFYKCNPVMTFEAVVTSAQNNPIVTVNVLADPKLNRTKLKPMLMPTDILTWEEIELIIQQSTDAQLRACISHDFTVTQLKQLVINNQLTQPERRNQALSMLPELNETLRAFLPLRGTDKPLTITKKHERSI